MDGFLLTGTKTESVQVSVDQNKINHIIVNHEKMDVYTLWSGLCNAFLRLCELPEHTYLNKDDEWVVDTARYTEWETIKVLRASTLAEKIAWQSLQDFHSSRIMMKLEKKDNE